jgi:transcriptional regulator with XRE-family HTH domain
MKQELDTEKLSKAIRTKRLVEDKLTLRQAAKKTTVSFATLSRMENHSVPEMTNLIKVCNWLKTPVSDFFIIKK